MTDHDSSQGSTLAGAAGARWLVGRGVGPVGDHPHDGCAAAGGETAAPGGRDRHGHPREAWFRCAERLRLAGRAGSRRGRRTGLAGHRPPGRGAGHPRSRRARAHARRCGRPAVRLDRLGAPRALRAHLRRRSGIPADDDSAALSHRRGLRCCSVSARSLRTVYEMSWCRPRGEWHAFAELRLTDDEAPNQAMSFDPVRNQLPGLTQYAWVRRLREPSYRTARKSRRR